jgi:hypothetical protein
MKAAKGVQAMDAAFTYRLADNRMNYVNDSVILKWENMRD